MKHTIKTHRLFLVVLFCLITIQKGRSQNENPQSTIQERLNVYYVAQPNTDTSPIRINITNEGDLFGTNPNMRIAQQLIRAIYYGEGEHALFRANVARLLAGRTQPIALILYDDMTPLRAEISDTWTNCVRNDHFFACAINDPDHVYDRIINYGSFQMNEEGLEATKRGFLRLFSGSTSITGWWDRLERPASVDSLDICLPYNRDYPTFRSAVVSNSEEIRRHMIYRSNPNHAENVIDRRPYLRNLHGAYRAAGVQNGDRVCLSAIIIWDERHYAAFIRFRPRDIHTFPDDVVTGETNRTQQIRNSIVNSRRVSRRIPRENPRIRMNCMLDLFERIGPERAWNMKTVNQEGVALFIDMSEMEKGRRLARGIPPPEYEYYPLRQIAIMLQGQERYRENDELYREGLQQIENNVYNSVWLFERAVASGSNIYGPNFYRLRTWIREQQEDSDHVYSCYDQSN
ncbi:hypothetical protein [Spongiimicrobium salis]|uniref:hypothetical protein n=1 Tax=Spongiimicrobium salis TaxID=1667022 RepID=UPI00374D65C8